MPWAALRFPLSTASLLHLLTLDLGEAAPMALLVVLSTLRVASGRHALRRRGPTGSEDTRVAVLTLHRDGPAGIVRLAADRKTPACPQRN